MQPYSVFIGIPTGGTMRVETVTSLIGAMDLLKQKAIDVGLSCMVGGYVAHNRNNLVRQAQEKGATHLMFIDADHTFPPASIIRLLDHDKDIVAANYNTRGTTDASGNLINVLKPFDEAGNMVTDGSNYRFEIPKRLFKVAGIGTGFMLVNMRVFSNSQLKRPFFEAWESVEGEHHTEDIQFCINARQAGYDIWCSPSIQVGHIGTQLY